MSTTICQPWPEYYITYLVRTNMYSFFDCSGFHLCSHACISVFLAKSSWEPHSAVLSYFPSGTSPQGFSRSLFQVKFLCWPDGNLIARILAMGFISATADSVFHLRSCFQTTACRRCRSPSMPWERSWGIGAENRLSGICNLTGGRCPLQTSAAARSINDSQWAVHVNEGLLDLPEQVVEVPSFGGRH